MSDQVPYGPMPDLGVAITSVGIRLDDGDGAMQLLGGHNAIYLHGSTDAMRKFAARIVAGADYQDAEAAKRGDELPASAVDPEPTPEPPAEPAVRPAMIGGRMVWVANTE